MFNKILSLILSSSLVFAQSQVSSPDNVRTLKDFKNYVINPDAEKNITQGVTDSSAIVTKETTSELDGATSFNIDATASGQKVKFKLNNLPNKFKGNNAEFAFHYSYTTTNSTGDYKAYVEDSSGDKVSADYNLLTTGGMSKPLWGTFTPGVTLDNPYYIVIESTVASPAAMLVDALYAGDVTQIGQFSNQTEWQAIPAASLAAGTWVKGSTSNPTYGTVATNAGWWRRNGPNLEVRWNYYQTALGSNGSGQYELDVTSALGLSIDTTRVTADSDVKTTSEATATPMDWFGTKVGSVSYGTTSGATYNGTGGGVYVKDSSRVKIHPMVQFTDSTNRAFVWNSASYGGSFGTATFHIEVEFSVPIQGWSASQSAAAANQTDYGWTSYTPTFTGFGTPTAVDCKHKRQAEDLLVKCRFTSGTSTATEARISFPNSLTSASTLATLEYAGSAAGSSAVTSVSANILYSIFAEPSVGYFTIGSSNSTAGSLRKLNGNQLVSSGDSLAFEARVRINGWAENQRAPTLIGSVTSNSVSALRIEAAAIAANGTATEVGGSDWISSCTNANPRVCAFTSSTFSDTPVCTATSLLNSASTEATVWAVSSTSVSIYTTNSAGANQQNPFQLICMGPR